MIYKWAEQNTHIDLNANEMPILKWARCHSNDIVFTIQTCFSSLLLLKRLPLITPAWMCAFKKNYRPLCVLRAHTYRHTQSIGNVMMLNNSIFRNHLYRVRLTTRLFFSVLASFYLMCRKICCADTLSATRWDWVRFWTSHFAINVANVYDFYVLYIQ